MEGSPFRDNHGDNPGSFYSERFYGQNLGEEKEPAPAEQGSKNWYGLGVRKTRESVDGAEAATPLPPVAEENDIDDGFVEEFEGYTRLP